MSSEEASGGGDEWEIGLGNQSQDEVVNDGHVVGSRMVFEAGLVFVQGDIAGIM